MDHKFIIVEKIVKWEGKPNQVYYYEAVKQSGNVWASTDPNDAKTFMTEERAKTYIDKHGLKYKMIVQKGNADKLRWKSIE